MKETAQWNGPRMVIQPAFISAARRRFFPLDLVSTEHSRRSEPEKDSRLNCSTKLGLRPIRQQPGLVDVHHRGQENMCIESSPVLPFGDRFLVVAAAVYKSYKSYKICILQRVINNTFRSKNSMCGTSVVDNNNDCTVEKF